MWDFTIKLENNSMIEIPTKYNATVIEIKTSIGKNSKNSKWEKEKSNVNSRVYNCSP